MDIINKSVSVKQLLLDPNNFRLDYQITEEEITEDKFIDSQEETLLKLEDENIEEIRQSILDNGFIEIDRIVVKKSSLHNNDLPYYIVVEGNRRTAALKTIYDDHSKNKINVSPELKDQFEAINVCLINSDDTEKVLTLSASLMGIRHVSGPKKWKGVQAAKLINRLKEYGKSFQEIGNLLGIDKDDTKRRYEGFLAFCQMKNDPIFGDKCNYNHYALLLEFIQNKYSKDWLRWDGGEFDNEITRNVLYTHLTKAQGKKRPEINNTTEARNFNRYLAIPKYAAELETGVIQMSELPDLPKDNASKISYLTKFISFLQNLEPEVIQEEELNTRLMEISKTLAIKLNQGGE